MHSDEIIVTTKREDIENALRMIEKTAAYLGFPNDYAERLRLLGEELIGSAAHVLKDTKGLLWLDTGDGNMYIHLKIEGRLSEETRRSLIETSKSGRNEPPKGLFAKIGAFLDDAFMSDELGYTPLMQLDNVGYDQMLTLSLMADQRYEARIPAQKEKQVDMPDLEKMILGGLADDITVSARARQAELTVVKKLPA